MTAYLELNTEPGHCCVCGKRHTDNLCQACYEQYAVPDPARPGRRKLPDWLKYLKQTNDTEGKRRQRNAKRLDDQPSRIRTGRRGRPRQPGVVVVSFSDAGIDHNGEAVYDDAAD